MDIPKQTTTPPMSKAKVMVLPSRGLELSAKCLLCNEDIELDEYEISRIEHGFNISPKVCDGCKAAIEFAKALMNK